MGAVHTVIFKAWINHVEYRLFSGRAYAVH